MRLILVDRLTEKRVNFYPLALPRPVWELRCGMWSLAEHLMARLRPADVAGFLPPYMAEACRARVGQVSNLSPVGQASNLSPVGQASNLSPVGQVSNLSTSPTGYKPVLRMNDPASLRGDDLLVVAANVKAAGFPLESSGPSVVALGGDGEVLAARIVRSDLARLNITSIDALLDSAKATLPPAGVEVPVWNYTWDLVLASPAQLAADFAAAGRRGIEGRVEEPNAVRGSRNDVYVAPGAVVHPMVVIDAEHGPVYIDEGAEIHPFTRIEGPCYIGRKSILLGAKCREGNSIGPMCRVGGEVEESIIHGYSNKYHDGFSGHAYVGEWVNLGALTTNSDLKNDYSSVSVSLDGHHAVDTGSTKVGALIGDHTKTSIGTLLNTGAYVGAMALIATHGKLLPKFVPSFAWFVEGVVTKGFGKHKLYDTAKVAMGRRKREWTLAEEALWDAVYEMTAAERDEAVKRGRRSLGAAH